MMRIQDGDTIITPKGVIVNLELVNEKILSIFAEQTVKITQELVDSIPPSRGDSAIDQATIQTVIKAIEENRNITEALEEAAVDNEEVSTDYGFAPLYLPRITEALNEFEFNVQPISNEEFVIEPLFGELDRDAASNAISVGSPTPTSAPTPTIAISVIAGDDIINALEDDSPVAISGTTTNVEDGQNVTVVLNGLTYNTAVTANAWSFNISAFDAQALGASEIVTADVSNLGGTPAIQATRTVEHDAVAPAAPAAPDMTAATDTGVSNTDDETSDNTPDFTVVVPAGHTATLYVDGVAVPATLVGGVLTPTGPIADGPHTITYSVTDPAGNESPQSAGSTSHH